MSLYLNWPEQRWRELTQYLDARKEVAKGDGNTEHGPVELDPIMVPPPDGFTLAIQASGIRPGGKGGPVMRWRITGEGLTLGIMNRREDHPSMPNAYLRIGSIPLMERGPIRIWWWQLRDWLGELGAEVVTAKLSRVDVAIDMQGVAVGELHDRFSAGEYATRAKKSDEFGDDGAWQAHRTGRKITGFRIGRNPMLRVYDKLEETRHNPVKRAVMVDRRWDGETPEHATRIEFQLRREWLKGDDRSNRVAIDTVEDWISASGQVMDYLTVWWIRFLEPGADRRHSDRAEVLTLWVRVQEAARRFWFMRHGSPRVDRAKVDISAYLKQIMGCCEKVVAIRWIPIAGLDDLMGEIVGSLYQQFDGLGEVIAEHVKKKRLDTG